MELVTLYQQCNYRATFEEVKKLWTTQQILGTPVMASFIEKLGITRHDYVSYTDSSQITSQQDFYKSCLALIIRCIDYQSYDGIYQIFESVEKISCELDW